MWILLSLLYGIALGIYSLLNKKMLKTSSSIVGMALFSTAAFVFALWRIPSAINIAPSMIWWTALKGFCLAMSWLLAIKSLEGINISKSILIQNTSIIITLIGGMILFGDNLFWWNIIGALIVFAGVVLTGLDKSDKCKDGDIIYSIMAVLSAIFAASSALIDKHIINYVTPAQVQFWFLMFTMIVMWISFAIVCIKNKKLMISKKDFKNYWAYLAGIAIVCAGVVWFEALNQPNFLISIASILASASIFVTFFGGIILYKERPSLQKYIFLVMIIIGMILTIIK